LQAATDRREASLGIDARPARRPTSLYAIILYERINGPLHSICAWHALSKSQFSTTKIIQSMREIALFILKSIPLWQREAG